MPATSTATCGSSTSFSTLPGSWSLSNGGLPLFAAGSGHAITGRPDVTKFTAGGYLVAFGTGRYIATADNTDLTTQRVYAVRDTRHGRHRRTELAAAADASSAPRTGADGNTYRFSTHAVGVPERLHRDRRQHDRQARPT